MIPRFWKSHFSKKCGKVVREQFPLQRQQRGVAKTFFGLQTKTDQADQGSNIDKPNSQVLAYPTAKTKFIEVQLGNGRSQWRRLNFLQVSERLWLRSVNLTALSSPLPQLLFWKYAWWAWCNYCVYCCQVSFRYMRFSACIHAPQSYGISYK